VPTYTIQPLCNIQGSYDLTLVSTTLPTFISFVDPSTSIASFVNNAPASQIMVQSNNYADKGLYTLTLVARSTTTTTITDSTVSVQIWMQCVLSALTPPPGVNGISLVHVINPASGYTPTSIQVPFTVAPLECGASLNLSVSPALSYLSIVGTTF